jgi:L-rhamnose mutarotase
MIRKCFVMQLNRGAEEEYRRRHNPIWKELEETLRAHGVDNYSIFLHPETRQLFAYAEIEEEARWNAIAQTPVCRRWWNHMAGLMQVEAIIRRARSNSGRCSTWSENALRVSLALLLRRYCSAQMDSSLSR